MTGATKTKEGSGLICKNIKVNGRRTSLRMEPLIWEALQDICIREGVTLNALCSQIDVRRGDTSLTAAIRVFIVSYYRNAGGSRGFSEDGLSPTLHKALDDAIPLVD